MVSVERPKTKGKFGSREKIRKWKTGFKGLIPRALFLGEMRIISPVSFEL
jgi:hypothetical protein